VKVIALMPVRNEAWLLEHSLRCLSGYCDVILVADQDSEDASREICRRFPRVTLLESREAHVCEVARRQLLDAARQFEGHNLLWFQDADEVVSPAAVRRFLAREADRLTAGTVVDCVFHNLWGSATRYRDDWSAYRPHWKAMAIVDDRRVDYDRSSALPLHVPRIPAAPAGEPLRAADCHVLHLQWLAAERNQMKQAWYRCREWLEGQTGAAEINRRYAITFDAPGARTSPVPAEWVADVTVPDPCPDPPPAWQRREILGWFAAHGVERFEPLEIWHIPALRAEFTRRLGRPPRPDRSYRPAWPSRVRGLAARAAGRARRQVGL
jgi:hypothetical protein